MQIEQRGELVVAGAGKWQREQTAAEPFRSRTANINRSRPANGARSIKAARQGGINLCNAGLASLSISDFPLIWIASGSPTI
jgi:hypothetical protein